MSAFFRKLKFSHYNEILAGLQWLVPGILTIWEAEIGRIKV
jgi:hypothetical protein